MPQLGLTAGAQPRPAVVDAGGDTEAVDYEGWATTASGSMLIES